MEMFGIALNEYSKELKSIDDGILLYRGEVHSYKLDNIYESILAKISKLKNRLKYDIDIFVKNNDHDTPNTKEYYREKLFMIHHIISDKITLLEKLYEEQQKRTEEKQKRIDEKHKRKNIPQDFTDVIVDQQYDNALLQNVISNDIFYDVAIDVKTRHAEIAKIESDMKDICGMFDELKDLVNEQQTGIDSIENNVETAKQNVVYAEKELVKAHEYQKKTRKLTCIILLMFIIVAIVLVAIFVKT
jgi:t-SNARE complex subunit (syntaxin)